MLIQNFRVGADEALVASIENVEFQLKRINGLNFAIGRAGTSAAPDTSSTSRSRTPIDHGSAIDCRRRHSTTIDAADGWNAANSTRLPIGD